MRIPSQSLVGGYLLAAAAAVLAVVVRRLLDPILGDTLPYATLFLAILVAAWYGGFGPAAFATVLGVPLVARFLLPPRNSFDIGGPEHETGLVLYLLTGTAIAALGGLMHRSRERALAAAAAAPGADA
ncbi:MAG: DUF4118 domain-containing protein, partial [Zavarzinella sp.]|nr:DUF4118 domain-containing protein [Zavarzinella sp.]